MKYSRAALAKFRMERSNEAIKDAELLLEKGSLANAVVLIYRSMLCAVEALLATVGVNALKEAAALKLLSQHFVKKGIVPRELFKMMRTAMDMRIKAEKRDFSVFSKDEVRVALEKAMQFHQHVKTTLDIISERKEEEQ